VTETVVENTPKHTTDDLGIIFFGEACPSTTIEYFLTLRFIRALTAMCM